MIGFATRIGANMLAESLAAIRVIRPRMTPFPRAIVEAILLSDGSIGSAQFVAHLLGLRNRFQLARLLKREGLPPMHRLAAWATILSWVHAAERDRTCLFRLAFRSHRHPAACYRLVREVTGLSWTEVRKRGAAWVERKLLKEVRRACQRTRPFDAPHTSATTDRSRAASVPRPGIGRAPSRQAGARTPVAGSWG